MGLQDEIAEKRKRSKAYFLKKYKDHGKKPGNLIAGELMTGVNSGKRLKKN
jgi:hypothetical protein